MSQNKPLHAARIEDYALIGDCESAALVCKDGSIDWLCWPTFSSGACFAALLGTADNGYFKIKPAASENILEEQWRYRPHTLIVEKVWTTESGEVLVLDFMPPRGEHSDVVRIVQGVRGRVCMRMDLVLRFNYGCTVPWVEQVDHHMRAVSGPDLVTLRTDAPVRGEDMATVSDFEVAEGESLCFVLSYGSSIEEDPAGFDAYDALRDTEKFWKEWASRKTYHGDWEECVERSLITLKALTYRPTGGLIAAPTTSLPEKIGGTRNWDYRFCWLRDTAFTLLVLLECGYVEEAFAWRGWLLRAMAGSPTQIQSLYGLGGERQMSEWKADWLPGYENSAPVSIGNKAAAQVQMDAYGEVITALAQVPVKDDDMWSPAIRSLVVALLEHLETIWQQPDSGIWEERGPQRQFVHSKIMTWVAFEQAIRSYQQHKEHDEESDRRIARWSGVRDTIHSEVCEHGYDPVRNTFVQFYGSDRVDASLLRIPLVGFLPASDPRVQGTVRAIREDLMEGDLVMRYRSNGADGLPPGEGAFLACSFWMVMALHLSGEEAEARALFERLLKLRNPLGLLAEEYEPVARRQIGNFPQAFTHLTMVHAAAVIGGIQGPWLAPN